MIAHASVLSTAIGLGLALLGPPLIAYRGARTDDAPTMRAMLVGQALLVSLVLSILAIVLLWEHRSIASLGLGRPTLASLAWGLALAAFFIFLLGPLLLRLPNWLGLHGFEAGLAKLVALPAWYLVLAVAVGGTIEEVLYRGFAVGRLEALTGSFWVAGAATVLAFAAAHVPTWGWGPAVTTAVSGAVLTAFYIWRGDLWSNIIGHVATDFVGIALGPILAYLRLRRTDRT